MSSFKHRILSKIYEIRTQSERDRVIRMVSNLEAKREQFLPLEKILVDEYVAYVKDWLPKAFSFDITEEEFDYLWGEYYTKQDELLTKLNALKKERCR